MKTKNILAIVALSIQLVACKAQQAQVLTASAFQNMLVQTDSVQLLDVRTSEEFNSGYIKNALWADWNNDAEFARRTAFLDKTKPVMVYCLSGGRSAAAAAQLRAAGYRVTELKGGINAWRAMQKPLESQTQEPQLTVEKFNNMVTKGIVLVDFGAKWCPPCKLMEPVLDSLQSEMPNHFTLLKVDGGRDTELMKAWQVSALPVFIIFKNGQPIWRKEGIVDAATLKTQLQ
jgi:thioredoxin